MRVYEKNGRWYLEGMIRGKRYHKAIPEAASQRDAEKYVTIFKADLLRGKLDLAENIGCKPFPDIADYYIQYAETNLQSSYTVVKMAETFKEMWKNKRIIDITPELIERYKEKRLKTIYYSGIQNGEKIEKYIKPDTINRELGVLSKMFSLAIDNNLAKENPVRKVKRLKVPKKNERYLTPDEENRIIMVCDGAYSFKNITAEEQEKLKKRYKDYHSYLKPIILMALLTGMRKGEILNMTWDCVDFKKREITALNTKNGESNVLPISQRFYDILFSMKTQNPDSIYIFSNPDTNTRYKNFYKSFKSILKLAEVEKFTFHNTRSTSATRLVDLGVPMPVVQKILNHKKIQVTMRYAHTMKEQKIAALEALSHYGELFDK